MFLKGMSSPMIVTISDDFDLQKIADSGQCFRCSESGGIYRFITGKNILYIKQKAAFEYEVSCTFDVWEKVWIPYFDLKRNYQCIRSSVEPDGFMENAAETGCGIRILRQEPWEMLVSFIISQRKNIPAIKKSIEALAQLYGEPIQSEGEVLNAFPTADALFHGDDSALAGCGLGYRLPYIKDAAARVHQNPSLLQDWATLDDLSLLSMLKTVKGVGDKVANCIMLFAYGRMASAPVDTWINKVIADQYHGRNPFPMYGNNAGIMQQYVFYYMQQNKAKAG